MDDGEEEGIDRLSHFPDHILLHILSFLDTKYSVQTSVLSTRWRSLWKQVTQLNFDRDSFRSYRRFKRFLKGVLDALSSDDDGDGDSPVVVKKVSYKDRDLWRRDHFSDLDRAMDYVESHGIRHISVHCGMRIALFSDLVGTFLDCGLDSLELGRVRFHIGTWWMGFDILGSLILEECSLHCSRDGNAIDFLAHFPCLKSLVLSDCDFINSGRKWLKISGPQLLKLEIHGTKNLGEATVQIVALKLKFLSFVIDSDDVPKFSQLRLPVLDHANVGIKVAPSSVAESKGVVVAANFVNLFQGLQNATSLKLDYHIIEAMSKICDELKHQPCSFTRLKCLKLPCSVEPYSTMLSQLITYFLKGSSHTNPVQFV